jgi:transposase
MSTIQAVPRRANTAVLDELYMSFELGDKTWKVTASDGHHSPSRYQVD